MSLSPLRHSTAHLLASAVLNLYPKTKIAIGPAIENGFYYDFEFEKPISEEDLPSIETEMGKIARENLDFEQAFISATDAKKWAHVNKQPYKEELVEDLKKKGTKFSFYSHGKFTDLCEGPHVKNTSEIKHFRLLSVAGAYWRGDEKNPMLSRIYGTVFPTKSELDNYLSGLEEAKKRDHKKLGPRLGLFMLSGEAGQGLPLILPNGKTILNILQNWARKLHREQGYLEVQTPHIGKKNLWIKSGHWDLYRESMFPAIKVENQEYLLKPMNCPFHYIIFANEKRSFRDLPIRIAEFGTVYRYEKSGELSGLLRIRGLTQDDAHIFLKEDQLRDEFSKLFKLLATYFKALNLEVEMALSLWDPSNKKKYLGDTKTWEKAQKILEEELKRQNIAYTKAEGEAAFYGPKIDPHVKDSLGRKWQLATLQVDFVQAERFNLTYTDTDGKEKTPVVIHRAPLGAFERTLGILTEHFGGAFPVWLAPIQLTIIPISDKNLEFTRKIAKELLEAGVRTEINLDSETMQAKIRKSALLKIPYQAIIGNREEEAGTVAIRSREGKDLGQMLPEKFAELITANTPV
ncbi:threonine--tRNA ligase [Candidatus Curtissbacteria bacterium]|nr:threonine--tRNA ligase [Candidatus Curtissbacteria bacterium]